MTQAPPPSASVDVTVDDGERRRVVPITIPTTTVPVIVAGFPGALVGLRLIETTGAAAAAVEVYDASSTRVAENPQNARLIDVQALPAGSSTPGWPGSRGIDLDAGIVIVPTAGSVRGVAWLELDPKDL